MASMSEIPITIEPGVAERVAELGMQKEFQVMLDHLRQTEPGLHAIQAEVNPVPFHGEEPGILLWTHREEPSGDEDPADQAWQDWFLRTFPPQVRWYFSRQPIYKAAHGR